MPNAASSFAGKSFHILVLVASLSSMQYPANAHAAVITWGPVFTIDEPTDVSRPPGSSHVAAIDFNTPTGFATPGGDDIINGIVFSGSFAPQPIISHGFTDGPVYDSTLSPNTTGDQDLDDLLDSYVYRAGDPTGASIGIDTESGAEYQIQIIGIADSRLCCSGYMYEVDNGASSFMEAPRLQRGQAQSVIGTFTAGPFNQVVTLRSLDFAPGNPDPGIAGLVVRRLNAVAEPTSIALIGVAGAAWLVARCRKRRQPYPR